MSAHTKGPWKVVGEHMTEVLACEDTEEAIIVADTRFFRNQTNPNEVEDARLIAAAPDLLEALERLTSQMMIADCDHNLSARIFQIAAGEVRKARAAIAKAKGEGKENNHK